MPPKKPQPDRGGPGYAHRFFDRLNQLLAHRARPALDPPAPVLPPASLAELLNLENGLLQKTTLSEFSELANQTLDHHIVICPDGAHTKKTLRESFLIPSSLEPWSDYRYSIDEVDSRVCAALGQQRLFQSVASYDAHVKTLSANGKRYVRNEPDATLVVRDHLLVPAVAILSALSIANMIRSRESNHIHPQANHPGASMSTTRGSDPPRDAIDVTCYIQAQVSNPHSGRGPHPRRADLVLELNTTDPCREACKTSLSVEVKSPLSLASEQIDESLLNFSRAVLAASREMDRASLSSEHSSSHSTLDERVLSFVTSVVRQPDTIPLLELAQSVPGIVDVEAANALASICQHYTCMLHRGETYGVLVTTRDLVVLKIDWSDVTRLQYAWIPQNGRLDQRFGGQPFNASREDPYRDTLVRHTMNVLVLASRQPRKQEAEVEEALGTLVGLLTSAGASFHPAETSPGLELPHEQQQEQDDAPVSSRLRSRHPETRGRTVTLADFLPPRNKPHLYGPYPTLKHLYDAETATIQQEGHPASFCELLRVKMREATRPVRVAATGSDVVAQGVHSDTDSSGGTRVESSEDPVTPTEQLSK